MQLSPFYYPENLEQLERAGAQPIPVSALDATALPPIFTHSISAADFRRPTREVIRKCFAPGFVAAGCASGLPIYAECGGLILLAKTLSWDGARYPMAGVFPFEVEICDSPQGHGYSSLHVDERNPFFPVGVTLRGHEFHYSRIVPGTEKLSTACSVERGAGCFDQRELVMANNVVATYTHLHATASPEWATGMVNAARCFATQESPRIGA